MFKMDPSIVQFMASQGLTVPPQSGMAQFQGGMPPGPMNSITSLTPSGAKRRKLGYVHTGTMCVTTVYILLL